MNETLRKGLKGLYYYGLLVGLNLSLLLAFNTVE